MKRMNVVTKRWPYILTTVLIFAVMGGLTAVCFVLKWDRPIQTDWVNVLIVLFVPAIYILGVFMLYRITDNLTRIIFTVVILSLSAWILLRIVRFQVPDVSASRYLWYGYYVAAIITSWASLVLFLKFGRNRIGYLWIYLGVSAAFGTALSALVMTNDLHLLLHCFPEGERNYMVNSNGPLYNVFCVFVFIMLMSGIIAIIVPLAKSGRARAVLPASIPFLLYISYSVLYITEVPWIVHVPILNDMPLIWLVYIVSEMVICMWHGIIQNNGGYEQNLKNCSFPIGVFSRNRRLVIHSEGYKERPGENVRVRETNMPNGYFQTQEDISEILALQEALEKRRERIEAAKRSLIIEQETSRQNARIRAQADIYYALREITDKSFTRIENLCKTLPDSLTEKNVEATMKTLNQIRFRLSMIKQECMLVLKEEDYLTAKEFRLLLDIMKRDIGGIAFKDTGHVVLGDQNVSIDFALSFMNLILQITPLFYPNGISAFFSVSLNEEKATCEIETEDEVTLELDRSFASSRGYLVVNRYEDDLYFFRLQKKGGTSHV